MYNIKRKTVEWFGKSDGGIEVPTTGLVLIRVRPVHSRFSTIIIWGTVDVENKFPHNMYRRS